MIVALCGRQRPQPHSLLRAAAVCRALIRHGVAASRLVRAGYGFAAPVATGNQLDYWNRALNRRVQFVVDGRRTPGRVFTEHGYTVITAPRSP